MNQNLKEIIPIDRTLPAQVKLGPVQVEGDVIVTGDIYGSYIAIGQGAQVIVEQSGPSAKSPR